MHGGSSRVGPAQAVFSVIQEVLRSCDRRTLCTALLVAIAYYAGAKLGLALTFRPHPISVFWPPNSILLAALLLMPMRTWWIVLLVAFPAHLLVELQGGVPLIMVLCWFVSNASEALIGAYAVRHVLKKPPTLNSVREVWVFISCAAFLAPFLSSFLDAAFVTSIGWGNASYWDLWRTRLSSNTLTVLIIIPIIVTWASDARYLQKSRHLGEGILMLAGLLAIGLFIFDAEPSELPFISLYLPFPFLLWAAVRFGPAGSSTAFGLIALMVIWGAAHGRGPLISGNSAESAIAVQTFLTLLGIVFLVMAASLQERKHSSEKLRNSEERFSAAFRFSPDAMVISREADGEIIDVNERCLRMFDYRREDLIGRSVHQFRVSRDAARDLVAGHDGSPHVRSLAIRKSSGEVIETVLANEKVTIAGEPCIVTIVRDVTELKRAEENLRRSNERFQLVLKATNDIVYDWDIANDTLWCNQNGDVFFGRRHGGRSLNFESWASLLHPHDKKATVARLKSRIDNGSHDCQAEYRLRRIDGSYAFIHARGFITRNDEGMPVRMVGSMMDITDRKRVEEANERLAQVSRLAMMGELTASIAHEINQPLGAILSNADAAKILLTREPVPIDEVREAIEDIRHDDIRAAEVIRRIRALLCKRELAMQPFDLNVAIEEVLDLVGMDLARHHIKVHSYFGNLPTIEGDQVHIQQVVLNLIKNAVDAMAEVTISNRHLEIRTSQSNPHAVEVFVTDSGPGIQPDQTQQLFDSFFTTKADGMGLGLSIARSTIEAHGGKIRADTSSAGGARFVFSLPVRRAGTMHSPTLAA